MWIAKKYKQLGVGVKASIVYTVASLLTKGLAIITTPIFTRMLTSSQMGTVNLYNSWYSMISVIATLSLTSGGFQIAMKEFEGRRNQYVSSVLSITSLMSIVLAGIYCIAPHFWQEWMGLPNELILLMLFGFLVSPANEFWLAKQRYEYKYRAVGVVSILTAILASGLSILVVIYLNSKHSNYVAEGRLFANYFIIYGFAAVIWIYLLIKGKTLFSKEFWKFSLSISIPLIGYALARQVLEVSDRIMISRYVGKSEVGIYSLLYTVSSISLIVWNAINSSFVPYLYQNMDKKDKKDQIQNLSTGLLAAYALFAIAITFFAPEMVKILATKEYFEAVYIAPPIAAGVFLTSVSHMYSNVLLYYKKSTIIMVSSVIAALMNVVLNAIFIPTVGYQAAAYTTLVAYIILAGLEGFLAVKTYVKINGEKMKVYNSKYIFYLSAGTIVLCMSALFFYKYTVLRYALIVALVVIAIICIKMAKKGNIRR